MWVTLALLLLWNAEFLFALTMKYKATSPLASKWYKDKQRSLTKNQKKILHSHGQQYIIPLKYNETIILQGSNMSVEIGCGAGDFLLNLCKNNKGNYVIGCDIHRSSIATCVNKLIANNITNCKLVRGDALYFLQNLPNYSINDVYILFPDPWSREKDHEKRIVRKEIIDLLSLKMRNLANITIATDDSGYQEEIRRVMTTCEHFSLSEFYAHPPGVNLPLWRDGVIGKYELKAIESHTPLVYNYRYVLLRN